MAGPTARSLADLRLMLQVVSGPGSHDPEVPPVPWRQARPITLTGLQAACSLGFPPSVAAEIRAGTEALAVELDKQSVIIEDWLPDPALGLERAILRRAVLLAGPRGEGARARVGLARLWPLRDYLAALGRRDRFMAAWDRLLAPCNVFLIPAMPMCALPNR
jgi:Asp-tRNA(Asn)/Glu-tRNA(Gln) amidotransferase A subunit family amidase